MAAVCNVAILAGAKLTNVCMHRLIAVRLSVLMRVLAGTREVGVEVLVISIFMLSSPSELQAFNSSGALVANVADNVSDSVGFVAEVTIRYVSNAEAVAGSSCAR